MKPSAEKRKIKVIVNPVSGTRSKRGVPELVERTLLDAGFEVEICYTTCRGDATRIGREAVSEACYGVLAVGGDGTVNETAAALCGSGTALGIIPLGSGNGLARHVGIPMDVKAALRVICRDVVRACDYATANETPFFCTCGFGFDAAVTHRFSRKGRRGLMTYLQSTLEEFKDYRSDRYRIAVDGYDSFEQDAFVVACCNASQYGNNAFIAPHASITDGLLDLTVIHEGNPLSKVLVGVEMMTGLIGSNAMIDILQARRIVIDRPAAGPAHLDGEPVEMPAHIEVQVHPGGLYMFTNDRKMRFRPLLSALYKPVEELASRIRSCVYETCRADS
ncbi:MAG: diacylglycerol kinase family lipid kinase [Muribaculaceae bacterium]|nr:diacylglycerol kinase family lipid kinase [Muribaculaceae bacterium]MDE6331767.1 diacylglycerol kinase family lipid kinase [Muribaculaceae bacterium]